MQYTTHISTRFFFLSGSSLLSSQTLWLCVHILVRTDRACMYCLPFVLHMLRYLGKTNTYDAGCLYVFDSVRLYVFLYRNKCADAVCNGLIGEQVKMLPFDYVMGYATAFICVAKRQFGNASHIYRWHSQR